MHVDPRTDQAHISFGLIKAHIPGIASVVALADQDGQKFGAGAEVGVAGQRGWLPAAALLARCTLTSADLDTVEAIIGAAVEHVDHATRQSACDGCYPPVSGEPLTPRRVMSVV